MTLALAHAIPWPVLMGEPRVKVSWSHGAIAYTVIDEMPTKVPMSMLVSVEVA